MSKETKAIILIVDDSATDTAILQNSIQVAGHQVLTADSMDSMWDVLSKEEVDLIVLDWQMPRENGISALRKLRANEKYEYLPIIMNEPVYLL